MLDSYHLQVTTFLGARCTLELSFKMTIGSKQLILDREFLLCDKELDGGISNLLGDTSHSHDLVGSHWLFPIEIRIAEPFLVNDLSFDSVNHG